MLRIVFTMGIINFICRFGKNILCYKLMRLIKKNCVQLLLCRFSFYCSVCTMDKTSDPVGFLIRHADAWRRKWFYAVSIVGILFLLIGGIGFGVFQPVLRVLVHKNLYLEEGKESFEKWKKTPIPVTFKVYIFNVTNPEEVMSHGAKANVQEVGPYVFHQLRSKDILSWDPENKTVTYNDIKQYHFIPSLSADLSNKVYSVNLPLQGIVMFVKKLAFFARRMVDPLLETLFEKYNETLFVHRTARELLFEGYKVELIEDLMELLKPFTEVPEILPNNTFGFLYGKNNSGDGVFSVFTGEDDVAKYSQIVTWNNMSMIPFWRDSYCNMMNGTDGSQFPPPVSRKDILYVYTPELCRSVFLEYDKDVTVQGIPTLRFITPERLFESPLVNPDNMCYCTEEKYCSLSGILDVSPCRKGLKLAVTGPHFYLAHKYISERITGLNPSREAHETFVDIEPTTGIVMRASRKLQMNFIMEPFDGFSQTKNVSMGAIPLIWVVEEAELTEEVAALFTAKVRTPVTVAKSVLTACIVLGVLWIATAGFVTVYILMKQQKTAQAVMKHKYKAVPAKADDSKFEKHSGNA